jgi:hypothetical protein
MQYTLICSQFSEDQWLNARPLIAECLKMAGEHHVEVAPGIWVFRTLEAAAAIHLLESQLAKGRVPFLSVPLSIPLRCGLREASKVAVLGKIGLSLCNISTPSV